MYITEVIEGNEGSGEYIDLFQSEWQQETNIWERLPCPLPFYIAAFHV